jgi:hypothetical protein
MKNGYAKMTEYGKNGWELVNVVSHPDIVTQAYGMTRGSLTQGAWFVATFKKST